MPRVVSLLVTALLLGCREDDCSQLMSPTKRNWCLARQAGREAREGDLAAATQAILAITDPPTRHAAIEWVISVDPPGMSRVVAVDLCGQLDQERATACRDNWDRDAVWGPPP